MEWARQWPQSIGQRGPVARLTHERARFVRFLAANNDTIRDAMGWFGWFLAAGAALFAVWELGGFSVLLA